MRASVVHYQRPYLRRLNVYTAFGTYFENVKIPYRTPWTQPRHRPSVNSTDAELTALHWD